MDLNHRARRGPDVSPGMKVPDVQHVRLPNAGGERRRRPAWPERGAHPERDYRDAMVGNAVRVHDFAPREVRVRNDARGPSCTLPVEPLAGAIGPVRVELGPSRVAHVVIVSTMACLQRSAPCRPARGTGRAKPGARPTATKTRRARGWWVPTSLRGRIGRGRKVDAGRCPTATMSTSGASALAAPGSAASSSRT